MGLEPVLFRQRVHRLTVYTLFEGTSAQMDYNIGAAIGAGLVATAVMTAILYMGIAMMPM